MDLGWLDWSITFVQNHPLWLAFFPLPLFLIAAIWQIFPHKPLVLLAGVPPLLSFGLFASHEVLWILISLDLALVGTALLDLSTMARPSAISAQRQSGRIASLGSRHQVVLEISNHTQRLLTIWVRDDAPPESHPEPAEFPLMLAAQTRQTVEYSIKPPIRGQLKLSCLHLRVRSTLGLWQRYVNLPLESVIDVYPDLKQLSEYELLARTNRLSLIGVRRTRKVGQDNEFERLRDYSLDDNYKHIDWRATARRNKLTVKDFQSNQSQRLICVLDCGRMMVNSDGGLCLLDHALNAVLMLSYVALSRGDSVGLLSFSDSIHSYVPPHSGRMQMNRLLHASFNRFPRLVESRYDEAFLYLARHCRRRSLVIMISNLIDEVNAAQVVDYLSTLVGHHLPLGVLLRDRQLFDAADQPLTDAGTIFRAGAASEIINWRHQVLTDLQHRGVLAMDVFPEQLATPLVNRYLDIKARHLL
ncbi:MAG: DUF58 domain-containing protein [Pirellulaceae bacterium]|nr:DUF58 domain-containing protein [Pirellulaceae bacterium]